MIGNKQNFYQKLFQCKFVFSRTRENALTTVTFFHKNIETNAPAVFLIAHLQNDIQKLYNMLINSKIQLVENNKIL